MALEPEVEAKNGDTESELGSGTVIVRRKTRPGQSAGTTSGPGTRLALGRFEEIAQIIHEYFPTLHLGSTNRSFTVKKIICDRLPQRSNICFWARLFQLFCFVRLLNHGKTTRPRAGPGAKLVLGRFEIPQGRGNFS